MGMDPRSESSAKKSLVATSGYPLAVTITMLAALNTFNVANI